MVESPTLRAECVRNRKRFVDAATHPPDRHQLADNVLDETAIEMPDAINLSARARQFAPRDPDVATCWSLVVRAIDMGWLDSDELRELISHLRDRRDFGVEELLFAHVGERLRVSLLDDKASCSPAAMIAALTAVRAPNGDGG
jgi:hypothetical protein